MAAKSITELRGLAQALGIPFSFGDSPQKIQQLIDAKAEASIVRPEAPPVYVPVDARLRSKPPAKECSKEMVADMLSTYIARGLHFRYIGEDEWHMQWGKKEDTGNLKCPPRVVLAAADRLMR